MGTFTIAQTQAGKELWLYPNSDGCNIDMTPVGEANNYQCVDEDRLASDEDTTYVYSDLPGIGYDLYELPDHTIETGTINYVQIYARAKSYLYAQHIDGIFKIILTEDACSNIYKSDNIELLINAYRTYKNIWLLNPRSSAAWTWSDIDNLQIGIECNSPTIIGTAKTLTVRPNAAGDKTECGQIPPTGNNYDKVDETIPDWNVTSVFSIFSPAKIDLYNIPDHTTEAGPITKITVFNYNRSGEDGASKHYIYIKTGGIEYYDGPHNHDGRSWILYSKDWVVNPNTSIAWTWADIDNLQIGTGLEKITALAQSTQVYAIVYYKEASNAEIRTTQCYAKINYDEQSYCSLQVPSKISVNHTQNIKMLNFWSGNRAVYGINRSKRTMVMTGTQYGESACEEILCIRDMAESGDMITVSELNNAEFNKNFRIISLGYKKMQRHPLTFNWILELEYED